MENNTSEKLWYVVNTYSGHESKVQEKLLSRAQTMGFQDYIFRVVVPEETVYETLKDGSHSISLRSPAINWTFLML